jgi:hypothetical protein
MEKCKFLFYFPSFFNVRHMGDLIVYDNAFDKITVTTATVENCEKYFSFRPNFSALELIKWPAQTVEIQPDYW